MAAFLLLALSEVETPKEHCNKKGHGLERAVAVDHDM
jgi:hypothetical protein